jgi:CheY-like chemotaxis protein
MLGENIHLNIDLAPELPSVLIDHVQFEQVIFNLTANARDAMPGGGDLRISVKSLQLTQDGVCGQFALTNGQYIELTITDSGRGMSEDELLHAFEPFYTTKEGWGTGLGLSTVYGIVRQNNGAIEIDSHLGVGTTFRILLPQASESPAIPKNAPIHEFFSMQELNILLAEDDDSVRQIISDTLSQQNWRVTAVASAEEALDVFLNSPQRFDLLITDLVMPGLSGFDLVRAIYAVSSIKVLYISGYSHSFGITSRPEDRSDSDFLLKPFSGMQLLAKIHALMSRGLGV